MTDEPITKTPEQDPLAALAALNDNTPTPGATTPTVAEAAKEIAAGTTTEPPKTEEEIQKSGTQTEEKKEEGEIVPLSPEIKFQLADGSVRSWKEIEEESVMLKAKFTPLQQANREKEAELADKEKYINQYISYLNTIAEDPTLLQLVTAKHGGADTKTALKAAAITAGLDKEFGSMPATQAAPAKAPEDVLAEKPPANIEWGTPEYDNWKDQKIREAIALTREQTKNDILGTLSQKEQSRSAEEQKLSSQVTANVNHNQIQLGKLEAMLGEKGINYSGLPQAEKQAILQKLDQVGRTNGINLFDKQYLSTTRISDSDVKTVVYEALATGVLAPDAGKAGASQAEMSFIRPKVETAVKPPIAGGGPSTGAPARTAAQSNYSALDGWQEKLHQLLPQQ